MGKVGKVGGGGHILKSLQIYKIHSPEKNETHVMAAPEACRADKRRNRHDRCADKRRYRYNCHADKRRYRQDRRTGSHRSAG